MDHFLKSSYPIISAESILNSSAMLAKSVTTNSNQSQSNQYLLTKVDSVPFSSTLVTSNEIINQASNSTCEHRISPYMGIGQGESKPTSDISMQHNIEPIPNYSKKKKKKKHRHDEKYKNGQNRSMYDEAPSRTLPNVSHHHYPIHHYVEQTESVIISTRKLTSVVESVGCPLPESVVPFHHHGLSSSTSTSTCHQSSCNINYHHSGGEFGVGAKRQSIEDNTYALSQSATISNLLTQTSSASSLNIHCQNEMANLSSKANDTLIVSQHKKRKKKKKRKHHKDGVSQVSDCNTSSPIYSHNNDPQSSGKTAAKTSKTHCDLSNRVTVSSNSWKQYSRSHSASSSSDCETSNNSKHKKSNSYRSSKLIKQMKTPNICSTSPGKSRSSSVSSTSSSSSYSGSSSSDDKAKYSRSSSSASTSSSSSSSSSTTTTNRSITSSFVQNQTPGLLVSNSVDVHVKPNLVNYSSTNCSNQTDIQSVVSTGSDVGKVAHQQFASFNNSSFSMDTLLHHQQTQPRQQDEQQSAVVAESSPIVRAASSPTNLSGTISVSKQVNTPLSVAAFSDDCNSIESPLSVESSGKESGKDESVKSSSMKRRNPAEERQRLRNYRIPHHLSQSRSLSRSSETPITSTSGNVSSCTNSTTTETNVVVTTMATTTTTTTTTTTSTNSSIENFVSSSNVANSSTLVTSSVKAKISTTSKTVSQSTKVKNVSNDVNMNKKDRTNSAKTVINQTMESKQQQQSHLRKPVTIVSNNSTKVTNPLLAPSHPQTNHYLNSSFFVPGASSPFPYSPHYPFSPAAFMPTLFPNQFLNNVVPPNSKVTSSGTNTSTRFLHPSQSQSQLTIFTSPTLGSNAATAHALSPFSFSNVGSMPHSALLSPTFSSSPLTNNGATAAPLLVPKFSPNFSFPTGLDSTHPLMMLGIANNNSNNNGNKTSSSSGTHHNPPFILPRISSTGNNTLQSTSISPAISKMSHSRQKLDRGQSSQSIKQQPVLKPASVIISTTSSGCTIGTNSQPSPLSTILHPQTLLLLPPQMTSSFANKDGKSITGVQSDHPSSVVSNTNLSVVTSTTTINITSPNRVTSSSSSKACTSSPVSISVSPSVRTSNLANSFIFSPNSGTPHLPYTLFSPQPPPTLMQPISIQAPPQPPPSSLLGTQLLLSVISPTQRNQLNNSICSQVNVSTVNTSVASTKSNVASKVPRPIVCKPDTKVKQSSNMNASVVIPTASTKAISSSRSINTTTTASTSNLIANKCSNQVRTQVRNQNNHQPLSFESTSRTNVAPITLLNTGSQSNTITTSLTTLNNQVPQCSYLLASPNTKESFSSNNLKVIQSPDPMTISPNTAAGADEFESLVRSVNDKIKSFTSSSEFDEEPVTSSVGTTPLDTNDCFNSKKMLSLMIGKEQTQKEMRNDTKKKTKIKESSNDDKNIKNDTDMQTQLTNVNVSKVEPIEIKEQHLPVSNDLNVIASKDKTLKLNEKHTPNNRKHKEKKREKRDKSRSPAHDPSGLKLEKKPYSRHKRSSRYRTKQSWIKDPVLISQIENLITDLAKCHISSKSFMSLNNMGRLPPPMFRISFAKVATKVATTSNNRQRRLSSSHRQGKPSSANVSVQSNEGDFQSNHCPLPLKKRQHRNPDEQLVHLSGTKSTSSDHKGLHEDGSRPGSSLSQTNLTKSGTKKSSVSKKRGTNTKTISNSTKSRTTNQRSTSLESCSNNGPSLNKSNDNLNGTQVVPSEDRSKTSSDDWSVSVASTPKRQPHGGVATVETDENNHNSSRSTKRQGKTTSMSSNEANAKLLPQPLPSTTSPVAIQKSGVPNIRLVQTTRTSGTEAKPKKSSNIECSSTIQNEKKHNVTLPKAGISSKENNDDNLNVRYTSVLVDKCKSHSCSSVDESSDADDEFDSEDESSNFKCNVSLGKTSSDISILPAKKGSTGMAKTISAKCVSKTQTIQSQQPTVLNKKKNGKSKPSTLNVDVTISKQDKNRPIKVKNKANKTIKRTSIKVNGEVDVKSQLEMVKSTKAKKRRRTFNRTGFDKPRKRNKPTEKKKTKLKVSTKITNSSLSDIDGTAMKTNKKKVVKKKNISTDRSSSTEIDDFDLIQGGRDKLKGTKKSKNKIIKRKKVPFKQTISSDSSDSEQINTSSSNSSQDDNENSHELACSVDDYPVYMVTRPSEKGMKRPKKVHQIKSNPFIRSIPSKKYYKVGLYSKEFGNLYPKESIDVIPEYDLVYNDSNHIEQQKSESSILPLPKFLSMNDIPSTSCSSSCSSAVNSSQEDEKTSAGIKNCKRKLTRRQKVVKKTESTQIRTPKSLVQETGYSLSFDIWYQYKFNPLPTAMSSANYRRVRQNVFVDMKPIAKHSHQACNCTTPKKGQLACGVNCINRLMYQECCPQTCPTGIACSNQRIQRYEWSPGLQRFMTAKRGWGIRTTEPIKSGEFILEYIGEIVSDQLFKKRMTERYGNDQHHYSLKIDSGMVIDGYRVANEGRFVNHSCEPNCEMQKWAVNGYYRVCMFALRDIDPNEELFYDYNFHSFNLDSQQTCHCGSTKCRGIIGGKKTNQTKVTITECSSSNVSETHSNENSKDVPNLAEKLSINNPVLSFSDLVGPKALSAAAAKTGKHSNDFLLVICKTKTLNMTHKTLFQNGEAKEVQLMYDPSLLSAFTKHKPLLESKVETMIRKNNVFMLRNYRKIYGLYSKLNQASRNNINSSSKKKSKSNRVLTDGENTSESDSTESRLNRKYNIKGKSVHLENAKLISDLIKNAQLYSNICLKVRGFVKEKLDSIIKTGNL